MDCPVLAFLLDWLGLGLFPEEDWGLRVVTGARDIASELDVLFF